MLCACVLGCSRVAHASAGNLYNYSLNLTWDSWFEI